MVNQGIALKISMSTILLIVVMVANVLLANVHLKMTSAQLVV
jgi:hypothetical protein